MNIETMQKKIVTGIGELLWDHFPNQKRPGGAPANVVYHATLLGAEGRLASRVGKDEEGEGLIRYLKSKQVDTRHIQIDNTYPTGKVTVRFNEENEPDYTIVKPVAWDFIEWNEGFRGLATQTDAVVFGTLAQRSDGSESTIQRFLEEVGSHRLKVLDVNFRQGHYTRETVVRSLQQADYVKMNLEELEELKTLLKSEDPVKTVMNKFDVDGICLTKGSEGSEWFDRTGRIKQAAFGAATANGDSVGLGDGFTSVLTLGLLNQTKPEKILEQASYYTSLLAEKKGGMPELTRDEIGKVFTPD